MITVVGGTGRLGLALVPLLRSPGTPVRVASRSGCVPAALVDLVDDVVRADVRDPGSLEPVVRGSDVVVSAVHGLGSRDRGVTPRSVDHDGNVHLVDAAVRAGVDVILVSVVGASPRGSELERAKWAAEVHLRGSSTRWTIVRATAYEEMWTEMMAQSGARDGRAVVLGRGQNPVNVVPVAAVARAVAETCLDRGTRGRVIEVRGSRDVRLADLAAAACAPGCRPRRVPRPILRVLGQAIRPVRPDLARLARMAVWMDTADLRAADSAGVRLAS